jgi:catechol 2,3-dioxygenase-like lactoylglutathione lyase family enzyme
MRKICLLLWLMLPVTAHGQSGEATFAPASVNAKGAIFALSVPDMEASVKWYSEKLGLKVAMQVKDKVSVTVLAGGGMIVELVHSDEAMPLSKAAPAIKEDVQVHGFFKAGILVEDFDKTLKTLQARNVQIAYGPYPAKENAMKNVIIRDNAGNLIQLFGK